MSPGGPSSQEGDAQPPSGAWAASRVHPSGPDKLQSGATHALPVRIDVQKQVLDKWDGEYCPYPFLCDLGVMIVVRTRVRRSARAQGSVACAHGMSLKMVKTKCFGHAAVEP